jgi:A/G-specific adenine glycosylase
MSEQVDVKLYFVQRLLAWYRENRRDLPWRQSKDPYRIWVSEIMLQQTRVDTVIPYFNRFVERFPTIAALAEAPEEDVLKHWEGLGYYSRARNLQAAVREVHTLYDGRVPDTADAIRTLKGVGPYTAGAILSIAYDVREPAVDGNVMRVMSRYLLLRDDIAKPATRIGLEHIVAGMIPAAAGDFNQALMELGATVCTPKAPLCLTCPVMAHCAGRLAGEELSLPVKTKAKAPRVERRAVALVRLADGRVLVRQRPASGLLAGMGEFPHSLLEEDAGDGIRAELAGVGQLVVAEKIGEVVHIFSHIRWELDVYACELAGIVADDRLPEGYAWVMPQERDRYTWPNAFERIWQSMLLAQPNDK